ncbi:class I adenylate cyclase [Deferrisoma palaeochoriense]
MAKLLDHLFRRESAAKAYTPTPLAEEAALREERARAHLRRRLARLQAQTGDRVAEALHLLPLLLHVNQPGLPGHVDDPACPVGIADYSPSAEALRRAKRLFPEARIKRGAFYRPAVDLVAVMGSAGSIGFTGESDLDVWICHSPALSESAVEAYGQKVREVEAWLNRHTGAEFHLFLQSTADIRANRFGQTDLEGCGSAMGAILKEEFYRTHVLLGGKLPVWWVLPPGLDADGYAAELARILDDPTLITDAYVDLGPVARVPLGELFGATVWQIVKGEHAPFKSALKLGLLEKILCSEGGPPEPLCEEVKRRVHAGETPDPYCVLFDAVVEHYRNQGDPATEDLLARCFYLKAGVRVDPDRLKACERDPGDLGTMTRYAQAWGWGPRRLRHLNEFRTWKFERVRELAEELDRFFLRTYQRIRSRLDNAGETQRITPRDLTVLGRRLQIRYRKAPHKMETLRLVTPGLEESHLTLYREALPDGAAPWRLYRGHASPSNVEQKANDLLRESEDPLEPLVWAAHNGLLGRRTQLGCWDTERRVTGAELEPAARLVTEVLARVRARSPDAPTLLRPPRTEDLVVLGEPGSAGGFAVVWATSWGEVFYRTWTGPGAYAGLMDEAFVPYLRERGAPERLRVYAPSPKVGGHRLALPLDRRLPDVARWLASGLPAETRRRYVCGAEGGYSVLDQTGPDQIAHRTAFGREDLLRILGAVGPFGRVETRVERQAGDLALIATLLDEAHHGILDLFVLREGDRDRVFVVDEAGNLSHWEAPADPQPYLLAKLLHFLENVFPDVAAQPGSPVEGKALADVLRVHTVIFEGTCRAFTATQDHLSRVRALGLRPTGLVIERRDAGPDSPAGYRITWGMQVIDSSQYPNPLAEVRRRILEARRSGLEYEVFVTRLFLDEAFRREHCGRFATTGHYLFYKKAIEQRLSG